MTDLPIPSESRELTLDRYLAAPRMAVWRAWTEPALLRRWFAPAPWSVSDARLDVRPGGSSMIEMAGPDGQRFPSCGVYLEVVEGERLVFTDAYVTAWELAEHPFMTAIMTLADENGGTRYRVRVRHWTIADRERHEAMGFHAGWNRCADQLAAVAASL